MILLDTSFVIRAMAPGSAEDRDLRTWLHQGEAIGMSTIAWAEFLCGPVMAVHARLMRSLVGEPVAFQSEDAALSATLYNAAGRRRGSLVDCMIAAVAIRLDAALATANATDFKRFQGHGLRLA